MYLIHRQRSTTVAYVCIVLYEWGTGLVSHEAKPSVMRARSPRVKNDANVWNWVELCVYYMSLWSKIVLNKILTGHGIWPHCMPWGAWHTDVPMLEHRDGRISHVIKLNYAIINGWRLSIQHCSLYLFTYVKGPRLSEIRNKTAKTTVAFFIWWVGVADFNWWFSNCNIFIRFLSWSFCSLSRAFSSEKSTNCFSTVLTYWNEEAKIQCLYV